MKRPILDVAALTMAAIVVLLLTACATPKEPVEEEGPPVYTSLYSNRLAPRPWGALPPSPRRLEVGSTAWERYLDGADAGVCWMAAGELSERRDLPIEAPFFERVWLDVDDLDAFAAGDGSSGALLVELYQSNTRSRVRCRRPRFKVTLERSPRAATRFLRATTASR